MNFQNLQSPPDDRYDRYSNYFLNSKGNETKLSNIEKTNLFPQSNQIEMPDNEDLNNKIITQNNINNNNKINDNNVIDSSPISLAELMQEKENLSRALKKEIIKNEEQRNYIQVLKETIESNLFRSGFAEILASSKEYQQFQEYNKGQGKTMADFVVDFIKFKEETNKYKKDLLMSNNIITDSKNEIDNLNKKVNDMEKKNLQLLNNINKEQNAKEYMLLKDSENNNIINKLNNNLKKLEEENKALKKQINEYQKLNINNNYNNKNGIISDESNNIEKQYKSLLIEYDTLKTKFEENEKQKETLEKLYQTLKNTNSNLSEKYKKLENELHSLGKSVNEVNDNYNNLGMNNYQDEINKLKMIINNKEKESQELYDKLNLITSEGDMVNIENRNNKQRIKDCMSSIDRLKFEKNVIGDEFVKLQKKYENILNDYNKSQNQNELLTTNFERLKNEYSTLLEEKNKQDEEIEKNINIKYAKDQEIHDMEDKFNVNMIKLQKENMKLNKSMQDALDRINELTEDNYKLKEINEMTNKQLREKIENEQILLKENMNYKSTIDDLNVKYQENLEQLNNKNKNFNDLNKNYNTVKAQYTDLQKLLKNSSEEKSKLINKNNILLEDNKNIEDLFKNQLLKLQSIKRINFNVETLDDFIKQSTDLIIKLDREINTLNQNIKMLNIKCFDTAQENQNNIRENNKLKNMLNNLNNKYNNDLTEKESLLKKIENYKLMNYELQKTIDDYGNELNSKISDLNNISYTRSEVENNNIKLNNDKEFLLTILLRLTKLFSHSNIYDIVADVFKNNKNIKDSNYQNEMNHKLLQELQRCEDYVNMLKENDLQANYLNLKLNQEIQDLNLEKLRNQTNMHTYSVDSNDINDDYKNNHFNTVNNDNYWLDYSRFK